MQGKRRSARGVQTGLAIVSSSSSDSVSESDGTRETIWARRSKHYCLMVNIWSCIPVERTDFASSSSDSDSVIESSKRTGSKTDETFISSHTIHERCLPAL